MLDWSETVLEVFAAIDPIAAWPLITRDVPSLSGWALSRLLPGLTAEHQLDAARDWMRSAHGKNWDWDRMVVAICRIQAPDEQLKPLVEELAGQLDNYPGQARQKAEHVELVGRRMRDFDSE